MGQQDAQAVRRGDPGIALLRSEQVQPAGLGALQVAGRPGDQHLPRRRPSPARTGVLPLGRGSDAGSEKGVECPGDLPAPSDPGLVERAAKAKAALGERVFVLGHHYQRDEVIAFADVTGDSFKLAREAAARPAAEYIVFCGVHFMAESADILTGDAQQVILPDLAAGCSMADMAVLTQVEAAWGRLGAARGAPPAGPGPHLNSPARTKGVAGRPGGAG